MLFENIEDIMRATAEGVRPPERLTVSESAERYRYIDNPGSYVGGWKNSKTPYLVEPQNVLTSTSLTGMIYVGPAQSGKTDMFVNWLTHTVCTDPVDMMLVQTAQNTARDFSRRRVDRVHRRIPEVGKRVLVGSNDDNVFDKTYRNGMILNLSWPSINELSGRPIPRLWLTDYDRMDQDIDGEGTPYALAEARITTFNNFGMVAAESSPGFQVTDPAWQPTLHHEAPPCEGILSLYNDGDRRRWYWLCVSCKQPFEPHQKLLKWANSADPNECAETAHMNCPHCGQVYEHEETRDQPGKSGMNQLIEWGGHARWVGANQSMDETGRLVGKPVGGPRASFWQQGVTAEFNTWQGLVRALVSAEREYRRTGEEKTLKTVINTKFGNPYMARSVAESRTAEALRERASDVPLGVVPRGARFLIACVDVQKNRWVVQVHAITRNGDIHVIDRYELKRSRRRDEEDQTQLLWVQPGVHREDWYQLLDEVMLKTYPLPGNDPRRMGVHLTVSDSAGKGATTANAYDFVRWLRTGHDDAVREETRETYPWKPGMANRFRLLKGEPNPKAPRVQLKFPDTQRKDRYANARGEIGVLFLNSNALKDMLDGLLDRDEPGGRIVLSRRLDLNFFKELTVETKGDDGKWQNINNYRNESWDLLYYCLGARLSSDIGFDQIDWDDPPDWAATWDANVHVFDPSQGEAAFDTAPEAEYDIADLAAQLG